MTEYLHFFAINPSFRRGDFSRCRTTERKVEKIILFINNGGFYKASNIFPFYEKIEFDAFTKPEYFDAFIKIKVKEIFISIKGVESDGTSNISRKNVWGRLLCPLFFASPAKLL